MWSPGPGGALVVIRILTQRQWHYAGLWLSLRISKRRRRAFLAFWSDFYDLWAPLRTLSFYLQHPRLYFQVRRGVRLLRLGRVEVEL